MTIGVIRNTPLVILTKEGSLRRRLRAVDSPDSGLLVGTKEMLRFAQHDGRCRPEHPLVILTKEGSLHRYRISASPDIGLLVGTGEMLRCAQHDDRCRLRAPSSS